MLCLRADACEVVDFRGTREREPEGLKNCFRLALSEPSDSPDRVLNSVSDHNWVNLRFLRGLQTALPDTAEPRACSRF